MEKLKPLTCLLLLASSSLLAQETPKSLKNVQTESILAAASVKIDGKLKEWPAGFQAYNKGTHLYYTMANDEQNLYLVIRTTDATTNAKITAGGITLAINTAGQKKEEGAYSLTYPIIQRPQGPPGGMTGPPAPGSGPRTMTFIGGPPGGSGSGQSGADSAMLKAAHERVVNNAKEIKVSGFKDIQDSLIAIYNDYKIKAAIDYDKDNAFVYELAIPLKLMGLDGDKKDFAYNIKLNGLQLNFRLRDDAAGSPAGGGGGGPGGGGPVMVFNGPPGGGRGGVDFQELTSATDFWGKYTLAKK
ncbi:MAG: hypothetical protein JWR50_71 [Mucilaginibacter sp.]|nr:hypothetical protein [Mucilaginibacter sp.]